MKLHQERLAHQEAMNQQMALLQQQQQLAQRLAEELAKRNLRELGMLLDGNWNAGCEYSVSMEPQH